MGDFFKVVGMLVQKNDLVLEGQQSIRDEMKAEIADLRAEIHHQNRPTLDQVVVRKRGPPLREVIQNVENQRKRRE